MKQFNFDMAGQSSSKSFQSNSKKQNIANQMKLNLVPQNSQNSNNQFSKNQQQLSPNFKVKLNLLTQMNSEKIYETQKSPIQQMAQYQLKQIHNSFSVEKKKKSLESLINLKNHLSPVQNSSKNNYFFVEKTNYKEDSKQFSQSPWNENSTATKLNKNKSPDYFQFQDVSMSNNENKKMPYFIETPNSKSDNKLPFQKRVGQNQRSSLTDLPTTQNEYSPGKQEQFLSTLRLPYIQINSQQLDSNIQKNKQAIKQMTQEMFLNKKQVVKKVKQPNKSVDLLEYFEQSKLPASSLANIKEAEFASPNSMQSLKKSSTLSVLKFINESKDNANRMQQEQQFQSTLCKITEGDEQPLKPKQHADTQNFMNYWQYKEKVNQNKDRNYKKVRQLNLQESLQKLESSSQKLGISSRLNYAEELKSPITNRQDQQVGSYTEFNVNQNQFDYSKLIDQSPQKAKEVQQKQKKKDEQEEALLLQNIITCEGAAQLIMEKFIEELSSEDSELKQTFNDSIQNNNAFNLGFVLKKYFLFCLEKVKEEYKQNHNNNKAMKTKREAKQEDLDSSLQNLILSEQFLEKSKDLINQILFNIGIDLSFIKEITKYFDEYGKFFIPQNNVKRIGMHNIEEILKRLLIQLVENHLLEKEIIQAQIGSMKNKPNYYLEEIQKKMLDFTVNLLNEHNESVFIQIADIKKFQQIHNFEYFMLKIILLNILRDMKLEWQNINIILEKVENIRLLFFREAKINSIDLFFDKKENHPIIKSYFMKNKFLVDCIGESNLDSFIRFLDQFVMGFRDYQNIKKYLNPKIQFNKDFVLKFGQELNEIIPEHVVRKETLILDIKHQLNKVLEALEQKKEKQEQHDEEQKQFLKSLEQINIQEMIYKLVDLVEYKIVTKEIPEDVQEQDLLVNSKFLDYFLHFTFQNKGLAFSYYDLEVAYSYFKMNSIKAFQYWIENLCKIINQSYPEIKEFNIFKYLSQFMKIY
ncbi:hypothetical protein TTHERM_00829450 (macronuclear) [Tetrahymena thermophila SB210]|uniref:Uncharacterized protein n=1 Tax=Tetrahymena thermophila (strain SB210) TaxID=312017 RepID=Q23A77_TETTS|nr:hypothetical protein TTHERM_00829450 [Tetrahymena thermophila SB210]EAR93403.2 hypothetical protein TTHERM_00829450 [Tetrahymena thermophila SB210]|eukprot:XP_001013648.2 hypothetical protein TTHERM_00829450 [Tetrahymena thermophila SB210]